MNKIEIPWKELKSSIDALRKRGQDVRLSAINHQPNSLERTMALQSVDAIEASVGRLERFERQLPNMEPLDNNDKAESLSLTARNTTTHLLTEIAAIISANPNNTLKKILVSWKELKLTNETVIAPEILIEY